MRHHRGRILRTADECVELVLETVGKRVVLGAPLGLGKANTIVNALYRRAADDPSLDLRIVTALSLHPPEGGGELERRLVEPLAERIFGGYPKLDYVRARRDGTLPANVRVIEFYVVPGSTLSIPDAQRHYISSNYTHVVRDFVDLGANVLAQLVAPEGTGGGRYSLSSNPDLTLDLLPRLEEKRRRGEALFLGEINRNLPFMGGEAALPETAFDAILDRPEGSFRLFAPPNEPVGTTDYFIALHATALIPDGGTLQLGIGSLGDAVSYLLKLRHEDNDRYREMLGTCRLLERCGEPLRRIGGTEPFEEGLYAASEMFVDGFLELYRAGVLKRRVYDDLAVQKRLEEGRLEGQRPPGGHVAHACFFLGPEAFYHGLRELSPEEREEIAMTGISFVNQLYGDEELKRLQRKRARFLNSAMMVTLLGAVVSDGLEDGQVVSGVGGQYNFVAMAHALEDGRSVIMLRSTREKDGRPTSNLLWSYGHVTIPRHLRDLVVTEYGIADLRGKTDEEVVLALLGVADSRFQEGLLADAKRAGKVARDARLPDGARTNRPERLEQELRPHRQDGLFPDFPFGTDLTEEEVVLGRVLEALGKRLARWRPVVPGPPAWRKIVSPPAAAAPYLERLALDRPRGLKERALRRLVLYALTAEGVI